MRLAPLLVCVACGAGLELTTTSDGGSYRISIENPPQEPGEQTLSLTVDPKDGELTDVSASMPSMGHGSDGIVSEESEGHWAVEVDLSMSGVWVLDGHVADESFTLELEVP